MKTCEVTEQPPPVPRTRLHLDRVPPFYTHTSAKECPAPVGDMATDFCPGHFLSE
jgi:hypothetical protein